MKTIVMTRDEMITALIDDTVERVVVLRQVFWLQGILEHGFAGFSQWPDDELRRELRTRGLNQERSGAADELIDSDGHDDRDSTDDLRIAGYFGDNSDLRFMLTPCD